MVMGVYSISVKTNTRIKQYIGSSVNIKRRWSQHLSALRNNDEDRLNPYLQNAWNKYGESCFALEVLEEVDNVDLLTEKEQRWINHFLIDEKTIDKTLCFNLCPVAGSKKNFQQSLETRQKRSKSLMGNNNSTGDKHPKATLTNENVIEIKKLLNSTDISHQALAIQFNTTVRVITNIASNQTWKKIGGIVKRKRNSNQLFNEVQIHEIRKRKSDGESCQQIANDYNVNKTTISRICNYTTYKHII